MKMPKPDKAVIDKRDRIAADLIDLIGKVSLPKKPR